jgi:hypothetical protein
MIFLSHPKKEEANEYGGEYGNRPGEGRENGKEGEYEYGDRPGERAGRTIKKGIFPACVLSLRSTWMWFDGCNWQVR